jgi:multiple RNA-binding domain-containing protein 1
MAKKLGIEKSGLFDREKGNMAVNMAKAEAIIVNQTREWMKDQGIDLDKFEAIPRKDCKRSRKVLLVKNIPYSTKERDLHEIFSRYGEIKSLQISPFNTLAIVEYVSAMQAQAAAKNLAYYKINYIMPIYLEFAPDVMASVQNHKEKTEEPEAESDDNEESKSKGKTVFIKNLNFSTKEEDIESLFKNSNLKGKVLSVKIVRRTDNQ